MGTTDITYTEVDRLRIRVAELEADDKTARKIVKDLKKERDDWRAAVGEVKKSLEKEIIFLRRSRAAIKGRITWMINRTPGGCHPA
jgi:hypothetical protein